MTIKDYNTAQIGINKSICEQLFNIITKNLTGTSSKIWHGAPVWFLDENPIVGYAVRKNYVQLLFWSGQSFNEKGLTNEGSFKAAGQRITDIKDVKEVDIKRWLQNAREIQWDYKNIVKRKGELILLK